MIVFLGFLEETSSGVKAGGRRGLGFSLAGVPELLHPLLG